MIIRPRGHARERIRSSSRFCVPTSRLSVSPPQPNADARDSDGNQGEADPDELGLDSGDAVRYTDVLRRILGSGAVREDEVVRPGTREIDREGTRGTVRRE